MAKTGRNNWVCENNVECRIDEVAHRITSASVVLKCNGAESNEEKNNVKILYLANLSLKLHPVLLVCQIENLARNFSRPYRMAMSNAVSLIIIFICPTRARNNVSQFAGEEWRCRNWLVPPSFSANFTEQLFLVLLAIIIIGTNSNLRFSSEYV